MIRLWWLSFADPHRPKGQQFLGACIVPVSSDGDARDDMREAIKISHLLKCNPGGEVMGWALPEEASFRVSGIWVTTVMDRARCDDFWRWMAEAGLAVEEDEPANGQPS